MKKTYLLLLILVAAISLTACKSYDVTEVKRDAASTTNQEADDTAASEEAVAESVNVETAEPFEYGIGSAQFGSVITDAWTADQDVPTYSKGKVSVSVDADNKIIKMHSYFTEEDMSKECALAYEGEMYYSIDSIIAKFGDFDSEGIIEFSNDEVKLHVEITNKDKGEYYISLKGI